jgi:hypothetical protein
MSDWPEVGDDVYYRRVMTHEERYDLGTVVKRPSDPGTQHPNFNQHMSNSVWEIETAFGSTVTRKGYELRIISQR